MKINIVSTAPPTQCGIGITNYFLMGGMKKYLKAEDLASKDIHLYPISNPHSVNPFYFINLIRKTKKCDVLHIQYNHDCFGSIGKSLNGFNNFFVYMIAKVNGPKIVTTFHEVSDLSGAGILRKLFYKIINFCPLHLSNHIIVTTNRAKQMIVSQDNINPSKISVIPLGAIPKAEKLGKNEARKILHDKFGIPLNRKIITLFGFIDGNKGHDKIIKALPYLENFHFLIAGSSRSKKGDAYFDNLVHLIHGLNLDGRVTFYGFVESKDFPLIMGASDLVVYPYSDITSSLALTTSISYNVPVITSAIQPFIDFNNQFDCIYPVDVSNTSQIIKSVKYLLSPKGPAKKLIENQKAFIAKFNWVEIAKQTIDVYKNG